MDLLLAELLFRFILRLEKPGFIQTQFCSSNITGAYGMASVLCFKILQHKIRIVNAFGWSEKKKQALSAS